MKHYFVFVLLVTVFLVGCAAPDSSVDQATVGNTTEQAELAGETRSFTDGRIEFVGYGPGKSHNGTFESWNATVYTEGSAVTGGEVKVNLSSLRTGISGLDNHLRSDAFFNVKEYPKATFSADINNGSANGSLTMHGQTRQIVFPVNASPRRITADFTVDLSKFNISHSATRDEARIIVNVSA